MRHRLTPTLDAHMRVAQQMQLAAAAKTPSLLPELVRPRHELLHRFAAYYTELRALPRRVRRALQRRTGSSPWLLWRCGWRWARVRLSNSALSR